MECSEVQKQLSAYIEKVLSPKQKALIDAHLKGCKQCKRALADLKKTIKYVQGLEEVEPPAWLAQKVMARVRSEAEAKRGIVQKFFYPFHIKLPLEAMALIFVAVGTIYVFKTMQPEMRLAQAPIEQKESAPPKRAPGKGEVHDVAEDKRTPAEPAEQFRDTDKKKTRARKPVGLAKAPVEEAKQAEAAPSVGAAPMDELERGVALSSAEFEKSALAEQREEGGRFVVNVKEIEPATKDIEGTLRQLGGKIINEESFANKAVIFAEIDSKKVGKLLDQLKLIGEVQGEEVALETWEGNVGIRIEIVEISIRP
jgi:hypothetical protein